MLPVDVREMAIHAAGLAHEPSTEAAKEIVRAIELALWDMRRRTVKEAAEIVRAHGNDSVADLIEQLIPEAHHG